MDFTNVKKVDDEIYSLIRKEKKRQEKKLEMIASENFASQAVLEAMGSYLNNKYAEGYPEKRYYGGCEVVDKVEEVAIKRAKKLFGCEFVNVQPHSGSSANIAAYFALLKPGDTVLGMDLSSGGHLTHGSKVNISGKYFNFVSYGVDNSGLIDFLEVRDVARKFKPKLIVAGASAYPRKIWPNKFRAIADEVGAMLMVDMAHFAGLVATDHHPSPFPQADVVTTTTHKTLRGPRGGMILTNNEEIAKKIDKAIFPGTQGGPLMHVIAAKAVCFKEALTPKFREYQTNVVNNAKLLAEELMKAGLNIVSSGTDNHLVLVDLIGREINGLEAEIALEKANITTNKNAVPLDPLPPNQTSGIRLGTPAITTRGLKEGDVKNVATAIANVINNNGEASAINSAKEIVDKITAKYPLY